MSGQILVTASEWATNYYVNPSITRVSLLHQNGPCNDVILHNVINPRRACAARVTVVGLSDLFVCLFVCPLVNISLLERLFVLKTLSHTQRATKVKKYVGFFLKPLRCRDPALPPLYGHAYSRPFFHAYFSCTRMHLSRHAHDTPPRVQHFSAFHYWICGCG